MADIPTDEFSDEYSKVPSEDEGIFITLTVPRKEEKTTTVAAAPRKEEKIQNQTGFYPTNSVIYPKLKFVMPNLDEEGAEMKPWKKLPNTRDTYFNYGFTEEVWEAYKFKQVELRRLFSQKRKENGHSRDSRKRTSKH